MLTWFSRWAARACIELCMTGPDDRERIASWEQSLEALQVTEDEASAALNRMLDAGVPAKVQIRSRLLQYVRDIRASMTRTPIDQPGSGGLCPLCHGAGLAIGPHLADRDEHGGWGGKITAVYVCSCQRGAKYAALKCMTVTELDALMPSWRELMSARRR